MSTIEIRKPRLAIVLMVIALSTGQSGALTAAKAPQVGFRVTSVSLKSDTGPGGKCPITVNFVAQISTDGPGTVKYTFVRSDGASGPVLALDFKDAGTQPVRNTWTLGDAVALPSFQGWQAVKVLSPNEVLSDKATFSIDCLSSQQQTPKVEEGSQQKQAAGSEKEKPFLPGPLPQPSVESTGRVAQPIVRSNPLARTIWEFMSDTNDPDKAVRLQKSFAVGHLLAGCSGAMISPHIFMTAGHCGGPGWTGFVRFIRIDEDSATPGATAQDYSQLYYARTFPWVSGQGTGGGDTQLWWLMDGVDGIPPGVKYGYLELNPGAVRAGDNAYSFWTNPITDFNGSSLDWTILYSEGPAGNRYRIDWRGPSTDYDMYGIGGASGSAVMSSANHEVIGVTSAAPASGGTPRTTADTDHFLNRFDADRNGVLDAVEYDWLITAPLRRFNLFQFASRLQRAQWVINPVPANAGAITAMGGWSARTDGVSDGQTDGLWNRTARFAPNATYRISAVVRGTAPRGFMKFWSDTGGEAARVTWQYSQTEEWQRVTGRVALGNFADYRLILGALGNGKAFVQEVTILREDSVTLDFETAEERASWEYLNKSYVTSWGIRGSGDFSGVVEGPGPMCLRNRYIALRPIHSYQITFTARHIAGSISNTPFVRIQDLAGVVTFNRSFNFSSPNEEITVTMTFTNSDLSPKTLVFGTGGPGFRFMIDNIRIVETA